MICLRCSKQIHATTFNSCRKQLDHRCSRCNKLKKMCDSVNNRRVNVFNSAHCDANIARNVCNAKYFVYTTTSYLCFFCRCRRAIDARAACAFCCCHSSLKQDRADKYSKEQKNEILSSVV